MHGENLAKPETVGRRRVVLVWSVCAALGLLLLLERAVVSGRDGRTPFAGAQWLWAEGAAQRAVPVAFYLVRDFALTQVPTELRLRLAIDQEYVAYVNGAVVGSGCLCGAHTADEWDVAQEARAGGNRLVIEARSQSGAGGALVALMGDGSSVFSSDSRFVVVRRHAPGLLDGTRALAGSSEPPALWGAHPTGRWRRLGIAPAARSPGAPVPRWPLRRAQARPPNHGEDGDGRGPGQVFFEFQGPVTGYLELWSDALEEPLGLDFAAAAAEDENTPGVVVPERALRVAGRAYWRSALPLRVGTVTVSVPAGASAVARVLACDQAMFERAWHGKRRTGPLLDLSPRPFPPAPVHGPGVGPPLIGSKSTT